MNATHKQKLTVQAEKYEALLRERRDMHKIELADLTDKLAAKHNEMIKTVDALKKEATNTELAHQQFIAEKNKKHSLEITE